MDIDFVVAWVDSNDPEWQKEYAKYRHEEHKEDKARYRNWDFFKYWFRAVERYAPWVNKIYLVTNGKNPDWINPNHPKLVLVNHKEFIPHEFLPTFNANTIELNVHRIKGLSEHFVYFNDDFYLNAPVTPDYYFKEGLPCDNNREKLINIPRYDPLDRFSIQIIKYCDIAVLNHHFSRRMVVNEAKRNWYGTHLGLKGIVESLIISRGGKFVGFKTRHYEQPFLKSAYEDAWAKEEKMLRASCTQFRQDTNLNDYFIRYWQFATNRFYPVILNSGKHHGATEYALPFIIEALKDSNVKSLCINDSPKCVDETFEKVRKKLDDALREKFPQKSQFEL